jgi:hypothetical protein
MNACEDCKYLTEIKEEKNGSMFFYYPAQCWYSPEWVSIQLPTKHYCSHWNEKDIK